MAQRKKQTTSLKLRLRPHGELVAGAGALGAAAAGILLAEAVGVGELAVGACVAFVFYRVVRFGLTPRQALIEGLELRHRGKIPRREKLRAA